MLGPRLAHDRESCAIRHCAQVRSQPPGGASNQVTGGSERRGNSFIARGRSRLPSNGIKQMAFTLSGFRINIPWRALVSRVAPDQLSYITELASHSTIALQVDMT
jgi:hypothetical protein